MTKKDDIKPEKTDASEKSAEQVLKEKKKLSKTKKKVSTAKTTKTISKIKQNNVPTKSRRGKKYLEAAKQLMPGQEYELSEAVELLSKTSYVKFDASVECHIPLNVDPKQSEQNIRGMAVLPHGSGKTNRVAVITSAANVEGARKAGADLVGEDDLLDSISKGKVEFDVLVATPDVMPKLGRHAKILGPKGLMPNPKSGTVSNDIAKTVKELKGGRIEFRVDPTGIVHQLVGKLSLKPVQLSDNTKALYEALLAAKPPGVKPPYVKGVYLTTSMGPSIKVAVKSF